MFRLPDLPLNIKLQSTKRDTIQNLNKAILGNIYKLPQMTADSLTVNKNKSRQRLAQSILNINNTSGERATPAFEHSQFDQRKLTHISDKVLIDLNKSSLRICKTNSRSSIVGKHQSRKSTDL